jgi:hypothetical protein
MASSCKTEETGYSSLLHELLSFIRYMFIVQLPLNRYILTSLKDQLILYIAHAIIFDTSIKLEPCHMSSGYFFMKLFFLALHFYYWLSNQCTFLLRILLFPCRAPIYQYPHICFRKMN